MKKGKKISLIPGTFDLFHLGHYNVLKKAKSFGDYLKVAIHSDSSNSKGVEIFYTPEDRSLIIKDLRFVDEVIFYERIDHLVKDVEFDVLCHGPDNYTELCIKAYEWCNSNGKEVVTIDRTEGISSTKIRSFLKDRVI